LHFFKDGTQIEQGKVTLLGGDQWVYEITRGASQSAGTRLTFTRQGD
jgi:hypothetical protein